MEEGLQKRHELKDIGSLNNEQHNSKNKGKF
jgi:hypothetical protein